MDPLTAADRLERFMYLRGDLRPVERVPRPLGAVSLLYQLGERSALVDCVDEGRVAASWVRGYEQVRVTEVDGRNEDALRSLVAYTHEFLIGESPFEDVG
jgi:hypothetical protein